MPGKDAERCERCLRRFRGGLRMLSKEDGDSVKGFEDVKIYCDKQTEAAEIFFDGMFGASLLDSVGPYSLLGGLPNGAVVGFVKSY